MSIQLAMEPRRYSISAIRSLFLLQGVLYHSLLPYTGQSWLVSGGIIAPWASATSVWLHSFRMQGFFFIAGILAVSGFRRLGAWRFSRERARRIFVPFIFVWLLINSIQARLSGERFDGGVPPISHLWFLQELMVFTLLFVVGAELLRRRPVLGERLASIFRRFDSLGSVVMLAVLALGVANVVGRNVLGIAWSRPVPYVGIVPSTLLLYGTFFLGGVVVKWQSQVDRLEQPPRWIHLFTLIFLWPVIRWTEGLSFRGQWTLLIMLSAVYAWCMVRALFGLVPMTLRIFEQESVELLSEAGYTVYLLHQVLVVAMALQLRSLDLPVGLEIAMLCIIGFSIPYLFHRYVLRRVPIVATLLNGSPFPPIR